MLARLDREVTAKWDEEGLSWKERDYADDLPQRIHRPSGEQSRLPGSCPSTPPLTATRATPTPTVPARSLRVRGVP
jgi:hypothetical protein